MDERYTELIREWEADGFYLRLWEIYGTDRLAYVLEDNGVEIFTGEDFRPSPLHAIDSDSTVGALLGFLSLDLGDTDSEYFDSYTPSQIAWRDSERRELLAMLTYEMEADSA